MQVIARGGENLCEMALPRVHEAGETCVQLRTDQKVALLRVHPTNSVSIGHEVR